MIKRITNQVKQFWADEQGAEGLEKLLIIGAIVLPLLGVLYFFKTEISEWVKDIWSDVKDESSGFDTDGGF